MQTREAAEGGRKPDTVERQWTSLFSALAGTLPTLPALWLSLQTPRCCGRFPELPWTLFFGS